MFANANLRPEWSGPPAADKIRARDQERLLVEVAEAGEPTDEDLAAARALLAERTPEQLAAALVRLHHARLPAPEELSDAPTEGSRNRPLGAERPARPDRPDRPDQPRQDRPRPERSSADRDAPRGQGVWFRMNIGRAANADPKWMIPIICRRGGVTKADIGDIRIMDRETLIEIAPGAAEAFTAQLRQPDKVDPQIRIIPAAGRDGAPAVGEVPPPPERRYDKARPFKKAAPERKPTLALKKNPNTGDRPLIKKKRIAPRG
jgi:ATP-dependent RNA helicase DeaD